MTNTIRDIATTSTMTPQKAIAVAVRLNSELREDGEIYIAHHLPNGRSQIQVWINGVYEMTL